jgi:hypothetical protein
MRKIHESDFPFVVPKSVNLFISISVSFTFFALLADLVFLFVFLRIYDLPLIQSQVESLSFLGFPLLCSGMGFTFGLAAKAKIEEYVAFSEQGCLIDVLIYSNIAIFVVNIVPLFGLAYLLRYTLD